MESVKKVALLTAGGLAPCLSSAIGRLIERYSECAPDVEIIAYTGGYKGLLKGEVFPSQMTYDRKLALSTSMAAAPSAIVALNSPTEQIVKKED